MRTKNEVRAAPTYVMSSIMRWRDGLIGFVGRRERSSLAWVEPHGLEASRAFALAVSLSEPRAASPCAAPLKRAVIASARN